MRFRAAFPFGGLLRRGRGREVVLETGSSGYRESRMTRRLGIWRGRDSIIVVELETGSSGFGLVESLHQLMLSATEGGDRRGLWRALRGKESRLTRRLGIWTERDSIIVVVWTTVIAVNVGEIAAADSSRWWR